MNSIDFAVDNQTGAMVQRRDTPSEEFGLRLSPMMDSAIKFEIPNDCRDFSPFARLPAEIRHQIWESTLSTPGMHFLKIQSAEISGRWWTKSMDPLHADSEDSSDEDKEDDDIAWRSGVKCTRPYLTVRAWCHSIQARKRTFRTTRLSTRKSPSCPLLVTRRRMSLSI